MSEPEQRKDSQLESTGSDHDGDGGGSEHSSSSRQADIDILLTTMLAEFEADDSMDGLDAGPPLLPAAPDEARHRQMAENLLRRRR